MTKSGEEKSSKERFSLSGEQSSLKQLALGGALQKKKRKTISEPPIQCTQFPRNFKRLAPRICQTVL